MVQVGPKDPTNRTATEDAALSAQSSPSDGVVVAQPDETLLERAQGNPLLPSLLLAGGVLLMILVMVRSLRKNTRARAIRDRNTPAPAQRIADIHQRAQSSMDPANKLMLDAEGVARRLGAQLDNKGARLELLLEEADRRLDMLNQALAAAEREPRAHPMETTPPTPVEVHTPRTIDPSVLDRARMDQDLAERATPSAPSAASTQDQIHDRILRLADDGLGCVEIARSLNQPVGQVELVLNLRKTS